MLFRVLTTIAFLLCAHGSVIRYLVTKALRVDTRTWDTLQPI